MASDRTTERRNTEGRTRERRPADGRSSANRPVRYRSSSGTGSRPSGRTGNRRPEGSRKPAPQNRRDVNRKPQNNTGTIRNDLERYRSDNVSDVKARKADPAPASSRATAAQKEAKKRRVRKLIIRLSILFVVILICAACFFFTYRIFYDTPVDENNTSKVEITIPNAQITDEEVGQLLLEAGCISDATLYKLRTYIYDANYVPGTYSISPSFSTEKIINVLSGYDYSDGTMEEE